MFFQQSRVGAVVFVVALALVPALLRWWWGRSLARRPDDPLIAERLHSHHARVSMVVVVCTVVILLVRPLWFLWSVPLLIVMQSAAAHPLSRALYGETWSLAASLSFYGRLTAAVFGFWALLAATPSIVALAGRWDWLASAALAVALFVWDRYHADVVRTLLRTEPIRDPALLQRFDALVTAAGIPRPRFECVNLRGGVLANALALPSLRQASVLFTDTLLSRLGFDETVGICAHEIAHLEYYDNRRLRRMQRANWVLIFIMCAVIPANRLFLPSTYSTVTALVCSGAVAVSLILRGRHRQKNETASDVRAVELTGNADAVAGGLTTLHAIARVPRRWDQQREQQSTHPSLARRIRDIHAAAGTATRSGVESPTTFHASLGEAAVTFDSTQLCWQERPGTSHLLDYGTLCELRLHASPSGDTSLVAVESQGRRWTMPTRLDDAAALQSVLDSVDGRLGGEVRLAPVSAPVSRLVALFGCMLATLLGHIAVAVVALFAALTPSPALLSATGGAALVAAAVMLRDGASRDQPLAAVLCLLGLGFLAVAYARRHQAARGAQLAVAVLALIAIVATAGITLGGFDPIRLHQGARSLTGATVLLVALAAACWSFRDRPRLRYSALAAALTGAATVTLGSTAFLDAIGSDPFLVRADRIRWTRVTGAEIASFDIPFAIGSMQLSPHGRLAAMERAESEDGHGPSPEGTYYLRRPDGTLATVPAADLIFIDDSRALLLVFGEHGAEMRMAVVDGTAAREWHERVPGLESGSLSYNRSTNRWVLTGHDEEGHIVRATGTVGQRGFQRTSWNGLSDRGGWIDAVGTRGDAALVVQRRYGYGIMGQSVGLRVPPLFLHLYTESRLWLLRPGARHEAGRSLLDVACQAETVDDDGLVCTAFDGTRTRVTAVDPATGRVTALGMIDGQFFAESGGPRGWLTGWVGSQPAAIRLATREAFRAPGNPAEFASLVAPGETVIGTAATIEGGSRIRVYRHR